ncbi:MAG: hypothetical protein FWD39_04245 [Clostridiales bacterium]|nr:hypothetical protein [Clostridiales bacterium]
MRINAENGIGIDFLAGNNFRRFNDFDFESRGCERNDRRECGFFERIECRRNDERRNCCRNEQNDPPREEDFRRNRRVRDNNFVIVNVFNDCRRGRRDFDRE